MHGPRDPASEVRQPGSGADGTVTTTLGGDGEEALGALGHGGIAMVERATGISPVDDRTRHSGNESRRHLRRPGRAGQAVAAEKATDKDATLAVDLEALVEPTASGAILSRHCVGRRRVCVAWRRKLPGAGAHGKPPSGRRSSASQRLRPAGEPERPARDLSTPIATRSFGTSMNRCVAASSGRSLPFRWTRRRRSWSANSRTRAGSGGRRRTAEPSAGARLRHPRAGQGDSLRRLRPASQRRLGQRWDRSRHGELRGPRDPALVETDGPGGVR